MLNKNDLLVLILQIVTDYLSIEENYRNKDTIDQHTVLFGEDGCLDSMGIVSIVVDIEDKLAEIDINVNLMSDKAMSSKHSPFRTSLSLAEYIIELTHE